MVTSRSSRWPKLSKGAESANLLLHAIHFRPLLNFARAIVRAQHDSGANCRQIGSDRSSTTCDRTASVHKGFYLPIFPAAKVFIPIYPNAGIADPAVVKTVRQQVIFRRCRVLASAPNWQIKFQIAPVLTAGLGVTLWGRVPLQMTERVFYRFVGWFFDIPLERFGNEVLCSEPHGQRQRQDNSTKKNAESKLNDAGRNSQVF